MPTYGPTFFSQGISTGAATPGVANSSSSALLLPPDLTAIYTGDNAVPVNGFPSALVQGIFASNQNIYLPMTVSLRALVSITNGVFNTANTAQVYNNSATNTEIQLRQKVQQTLASLATQVNSNGQNNQTPTQTQINSNFQTLSGIGTQLDQTFVTQNPQNISIDATSLAMKVNAMNQLPPLIFLINPTTFSKSLTKKTEEFFTRAGWNQEYWGEELDSFSLEGQIGATYTDKFGITRFFRRDSSSYQNLMQLYLYYKNNGRIFEDLDPRRIAIVANVVITYDSVTYIGVFDEFNITETAEQPFSLNYSFTFTARQTVLPSF